MPSEQIQFRIEERLAQTLRERAGEESANLIARLDLLRYYHLLSLARSDLRFTADEIGFIADANNGTAMFPAIQDEGGAAVSALHLWANLADYPNPERWNHNTATQWTLVMRLRTLAPVQLFALADAVERFWVNQQGTHHVDFFRSLGLQIDTTTS